MGVEIAERREARRKPASSLRMIHATMRPGCPVQVIDLSPTGAQVESDRPMHPGSRVHFRLVCEDRTLAVAARVLRCVVWALRPDSGVTYRGALRFEEPCQALADS